AEAGARETLAVRVGDTAAAVETERRVRADADEALAQSIVSLEAELSSDIAGNASAFSGLSATVTEQGGTLTALSSDLVELTARVGDAEGEISTLAATRVTATEAVSAVNTEISATYGDVKALAGATAIAEATLDGISESFVWSLGGSDVLSLVRVSDGGAPVTTARIRGDYIRLDGDTEITGNFLVRGENIVLDGDTAVTGAFKVTNANIAGTLQSTTQSANAGW
ncbi:hypothetical protein, partial [Roseivivax isoporae]|uniref:hypothetical protein n=1 Tax=Roseivivax isoporae TaxID=591206 RepID=UPI0005C1B666